jgi:hypothetical protein
LFARNQKWVARFFHSLLDQIQTFQDLDLRIEHGGRDGQVEDPLPSPRTEGDLGAQGLQEDLGRDLILIILLEGYNEHRDHNSHKTGQDQPLPFEEDIKDVARKLRVAKILSPLAEKLKVAIIFGPLRVG